MSRLVLDRDHVFRGLPYRDVPVGSRLPFRITPRNVSMAIPYDPEQCGAANALCDIPGIVKVVVEKSVVRVLREGTNVWERWKTPHDLRKNVLEANDQGAQVAVFAEYVLTAHTAVRHPRPVREGTKHGKRSPRRRAVVTGTARRSTQSSSRKRKQ